MASCGGFLLVTGVLALLDKNQDGIAFLLLGASFLLQLVNKPSSGTNATDIVSFILMVNGIIFLIAAYVFELRVFAQ